MVFVAGQELLDRETAVKMRQPDAVKDSGARTNFVAEAMVAGELKHRRSSEKRAEAYA